MSSILYYKMIIIARAQAFGGDVSTAISEPLPCYCNNYEGCGLAAIKFDRRGLKLSNR